MKGSLHSDRGKLEMDQKNPSEYLQNEFLWKQ
jgi:hypothetical protein